VRGPELHARAQQKVAAFAEMMGARVEGLAASTIAGTDGNLEFFICLRKPLV
jgi:predicted rRNA methylase YqxC with S4 and FtsJ domains